MISQNKIVRMESIEIKFLLDAFLLYTSLQNDKIMINK